MLVKVKFKLIKAQIKNPKLTYNGKMKAKFEKNLRLQLDRVSDSESNDGILSSLALSGGKLWLFEIYKIAEHLQPTHNFF